MVGNTEWLKKRKNIKFYSPSITSSRKLFTALKTALWQHLILQMISCNNWSFQLLLSSWLVEMFTILHISACCFNWNLPLEAIWLGRPCQGTWQQSIYLVSALLLGWTGLVLDLPLGLPSSVIKFDKIILIFDKHFLLPMKYNLKQ